jgi:hypothetical protein
MCLLKFGDIAVFGEFVVSEDHEWSPVLLVHAMFDFVESSMKNYFVLFCVY